MKRISTLIFAFLCIAFCVNDLNAQSYKAAAGARLGYPVSLSYKQFTSEKMAFEVYAGTRGWIGYRWVNVSGALLFHKPISELEGLSWYYGGGASVFFWNYDNTFIENDASVSFAIQGYLGLDYAFSDLPINLTIDWVPSIFLNGFGSGFGGGYGSLGVRYIFKQE